MPPYTERVISEQQIADIYPHVERETCPIGLRARLLNVRSGARSSRSEQFAHALLRPSRAAAHERIPPRLICVFWRSGPEAAGRLYFRERALSSSTRST